MGFQTAGLARSGVGGELGWYGGGGGELGG